jgi:hypothetical protein
MRLQSIDPLVVFTREYSIDVDANTVESRSKQQDEHQGNYIDIDDAESASHAPTTTSGVAPVNSDPFVKAHDIVFDIRVKRVVDPSHLKHHPYMTHQPCQFRDVSQADLDHAGFRVDSRDYSSLTEINTIFEGKCLFIVVITLWI